MPRRGLIISATYDVHSFAVHSAARDMGFDLEIIDSAEYLDAFSLEFHLHSGVSLATLSLSCGRTINLKDLSGLWWRRPLPPTLEKHVVHPGTLEAARAEASQAVYGTLMASVSNTFNDMGRSRVASFKTNQLQRAAEIGLNVPRTLITSSAVAAECFYLECRGEVIYKLFKGTDIGFYETRRLFEGDIVQLYRLAKCPILLQEFVHGEFDIRVTVVGKQLFAARIDFDGESTTVDSRFTSTGVSVINIPADVQRAVLRMVESFGLRYCTVDLRYSESRGFVFFEINPEGQYLWTEIEAGLQISRSIACEILGVE